MASYIEPILSNDLGEDIILIVIQCFIHAMLMYCIFQACLLCVCIFLLSSVNPCSHMLHYKLKTPVYIQSAPIYIAKYARDNNYTKVFHYLTWLHGVAMKQDVTQHPVSSNDLYTFLNLSETVCHH